MYNTTHKVSLITINFLFNISFHRPKIFKSPNDILILSD